ncbi:MAG: hypothetical protein GY725_11395 [bacterium]|nr:hypothetical protein [bacterium]
MVPTIFGVFAYAILWVGIAGSADAQVLVANDDEFGIPWGLTLVVEEPGVLENDTLDGENAGESGATAELVSDASHGTLVLASDGSFTYSPGPSFNGSDSFIYRALASPATPVEATVSLTACWGGPQVFTCWNESAFRAKIAELGHPSFDESFEDDATWGASRHPSSSLSVISQGIEWRANDFDPTHTDPPAPTPPAPNTVQTGPGANRTGSWGVWDGQHGYAWGTAGTCDVDTPPAHCVHHDGITLQRVPGLNPIFGAGGYFTGIHGANMGFVLDGDYQNPIDGGKIWVGPHVFFGIVDAGPVGFSEIQFRELDGKIGQALYVWADDFTIVADPLAVPVPTLSPVWLLGLVLVIAVAGCSIRA